MLLRTYFLCEVANFYLFKNTLIKFKRVLSLDPEYYKSIKIVTFYTLKNISIKHT